LILLIFSKNQLFVSLILCMVILVSISLISPLIFIISLLLFVWNLLVQEISLKYHPHDRQKITRPQITPITQQKNYYFLCSNAHESPTISAVPSSSTPFFFKYLRLHALCLSFYFCNHWDKSSLKSNITSPRFFKLKLRQEE
jgi:hypothetical protein